MSFAAKYRGPLSLLPKFILCSGAFGQVAVTATLTDGTGTISRTAYLHFQLQNCGANIPVEPGHPTVVVQDSFDLRPSTPGSSISGSILGNDQISCGNVASTFTSSPQ
jgi:hypothetical protein